MELLVAATAVSDQVAGHLHRLVGLDTTTVVNILRIIGIDIILAGDNAVVIALACRSLPPRQRMAGIVLGAGVAVLLRIFFTVVIQQLLEVQWLKLIGGMLLFWIAIKLLTSEEGKEDGIKSGSSLWEAVRIVAIADLVMSLDNMLAIAAAAGGNTYLIIFGLALSIPLVIAGSTLIMRLLTRFPILVWAGAALLGWIAGELVATEPVLAPIMQDLSQTMLVTPKAMARILEILGAFLVLLVGWVVVRRSGQRVGHV